MISLLFISFLRLRVRRGPLPSCAGASDAVVGSVNLPVHAGYLRQWCHFWITDPTSLLAYCPPGRIWDFHSFLSRSLFFHSRSSSFSIHTFFNNMAEIVCSIYLPSACEGRGPSQADLHPFCMRGRATTTLNHFWSSWNTQENQWFRREMWMMFRDDCVEDEGWGFQLHFTRATGLLSKQTT